MLASARTEKKTFKATNFWSNMTLPSSHHSKCKIPPKFPKPRSAPKHGAEFIRDKIMSMNFKDTRFDNGDGQGKCTDDTELWSGASVPLTNGPHTKIVWVHMRAIEKGPYGAIVHGAVISNIVRCQSLLPLPHSRDMVWQD